MFSPEERGRLEAWLRIRLGVCSDVNIDHIERIPGGASLETIRVGCSIAGEHDKRWLIVRRSPDSGLIETDREVEFAAYRTFANTLVPVPHAIGLESGPDVLGAPFFVAEEIRGCYSTPTELDRPRWDPYRGEMGRQFWSTLGELCRIDVAGTPLANVLDPVDPDQAWKGQLAHWTDVINADEDVPDPLLHAAIRTLEQHPPPPPERCVIVHGDYRTGNFLFDEDGRIRAVLDWEMCHLGDPLEDVAWALSGLWRGADQRLVGRLLDREQATETWARKSGMSIDPRALDWWELFTAVKGAAIWLSAGAEVAAGRSSDAVMLQAGWVLSVRQQRHLADALVNLLEAR